MSQLFRLVSLVSLIVFLLLMPCVLFASGGDGAAPALMIPSIGVSTPIVEFPLGSPSWVIDPWERHVGHLEGTSGLAQSGNVVLAAHAKMPNLQDGIFANLRQLHEGDTIIVFDGYSERSYHVTRILYVDYTDISVVYPTTHEQLTLITCDTASGYDAERQDYGQRIVIVATPAN
jgi:LPXTG-site transpeptidase (sortase) family protein